MDAPTILLAITVATLAAALALAAISGAAVWWHDRAQARRRALAAATGLQAMKNRATAQGRTLAEYVASGDAVEECAHLSRRYAREVHGAHLPEE